jgi:predicted dehydrogenase
MNLRIGLVGAGWMGRAHVNAFTNAAMIFGNQSGKPVFEMVADVDENSVKKACAELNFSRWTTDWKELVADENIDIVDVATPNAYHYEIVKEALNNGKHVYCEKPLTLSHEESRELAELAAANNVINYVGYNNLMNPAIAYVKELLTGNKLGEIVHFNGTYDQDGLLDPSLPITWRHINKFSGSGALGDLATHLLSISQYLLGDMKSVNALSKTFIKNRPVREGADELAAVENDDVVSLLAQYKSGAMGTISSSRIAAGRKNYLSFEIQGTEGSVHYSLENMNEVHVYFTADNPRDRGFRKVFLSPEHEGYGAFQPAAGIAIGYNDMKVLEANTVLEAVMKGISYVSDFAFASRIDATVKAVLESAENQEWVKIKYEGGVRI